MRTFGQRRRIWATMRAISPTAPAAASILAGRSFAANKCRLSLPKSQIRA
jgi:hypothetical protein